MEMYELVQRYLGRRVEVMVHSYTRISGEVASVFEDCVRLIDTTTYDELDSKSWQTTGEPETVVCLRSISAITCLDDKLRDEPPPGIPELRAGEPPKTEDEKPVTLASNQTPATEDRIEMLLGAGLLRLVSQQQDGGLLDQIAAARTSVAKEMGLEIPQVRVRDDLSLPLNGYSIKIHGVERAQGEIQPGMQLAVSNADTTSLQLAGESFKEPVFGYDAWWINENMSEKATTAGYTVVPPATVIVTHLRHTCAQHAAQLLSLEDLWTLLARLRESYNNAAITTLEHSRFIQFHRVVTALLSEQISIHRLSLILESFLRNTTASTTEKWCDNDLFYSVLSQIRVDLRDIICAPLLDEKGQLQAAILCDTFPSLLTKTCHLNELAEHRERQRNLVQQFTSAGINTLLVEDTQRQAIADIIRPLAPTIHVLSRSEIPPHVALQIVDLPAPHSCNAATPQQPR